MEPSCKTWSSYGPPYPLGRWSSVIGFWSRLYIASKKKKQLHEFTLTQDNELHQLLDGVIGTSATQCQMANKITLFYHDPTRTWLIPLVTLLPLIATYQY